MTHNDFVELGDIADNTRLISIDNWDELLDPPERPGAAAQIGVVRACNNWQARLATMSVSIQSGHQTMIMPGEEVCEECVLECHTPLTKRRGTTPQVIIW